MLDFELRENDALLIVRPTESLSAGDFESLARTVDPFIERQGALSGLMIDTASFPGWDGLTGFVSHVRFVREHHRKIRRVAVVSDSDLLSAMPRLADHFVAAEIRHFPAAEREAAVAWLTEAPQ